MPLESLVSTPLAKALGWALFHSLWEGALAAIIVAAALVASRSPRVRYACACLAMLGALAGFVATLAYLMPREAAAVHLIPRALPRAPLDAGGLPVNARALRMADILPWLAPFWIAGVILFHLRGVAGWLAAGRLRQRGVCLAPEVWLRRLDTLRARLHVSKPVALFETALANVPVVVGYLRPAILIPAGLLAGMPDAQLQAILLHELAHIRRHDYLVNLLETVVEGFLFYHPAIWWISGVIRAERENCCDDLVVEASGNAHAYATALAALEETRWAASQAALAATGGNLMKRIHRLLYQPKGSAFAPLVSAGILTLAAVGGLLAWQAASPAPAAAPQKNVSPYTRWLNEDVVYIIEKREREAFLGLQTDSERVHFIQQFWERRNPTPGSPQNAFQMEHYRRIAYANKRFAWRDMAGWKTDRGRIYILYGPPDEIESHPHPEGRLPFEQWRYYTIKGIGTNVIIEYVDKDSTGDYRMTEDPNARGGELVQHP